MIIRKITLPATVKTYSSYTRACKYGKVRSASPVHVNGVARWLAMPIQSWDGHTVYQYIIKEAVK